jgi:hypothetical protein
MALSRPIVQQGIILHTVTEHGFDLRVGHGPYRLRLAVYGWRFFLIRVPFIGKAWSFGPGVGGYSSWSEVRQEAAYAED